MRQADARAEYGPEEEVVLRNGRCHLQLFPCLKDRETPCFLFTLSSFPALCVFMKAISIRYIKLLSLQAPLDNSLISPASSLTCPGRSASPACSIAISVSHNTAAPDGRQGKHLPPELSPIQFPSINQHLGVKNHSLLCLARSCQRLSTLELGFLFHPVLGEGKAWSFSQISHMAAQPTTSKHHAKLGVWRGFYLSTLTCHFWYREWSFLACQAKHLVYRWDLVSLASIQKTEEHYMCYSNGTGASDWQAKGTSGLACGKKAHWINVIAHARSAGGRSSRSWLVNCDNGENLIPAL